jgi:hypothetical protein
MLLEKRARQRERAAGEQLTDEPGRAHPER